MNTNININGKKFSNYETANEYLKELTSEKTVKAMEAVRTIGKYCDEHHGCDGCPFSRGSSCVFHYEDPTRWGSELGID